MPTYTAETTVTDVTVRDARADDAEAIARIYNQGIEDRVATLETAQRTPEERRDWLAARSPRHPVLVAIDGVNQVLGWASLNQFNPRPAYDHVADFSVYVAREARGKGVGVALLEALEARARQIGFHKLVLAAFPTNSARHAPVYSPRIPGRGHLPRAGKARRRVGGRRADGEDPELTLTREFQGSRAAQEDRA